MEKAYDLKELGKRLKEAGLVEVEDMAEKTYKITKQWVKDSAVISKTPLDDMAAPFLDNLDNLILPKVDAIDGIEGN